MIAATEKTVVDAQPAKTFDRWSVVGVNLVGDGIFGAITAQLTLRLGRSTGDGPRDWEYDPAGRTVFITIPDLYAEIAQDADPVSVAKAVETLIAFVVAAGYRQKAL